MILSFFYRDRLSLLCLLLMYSAIDNSINHEIQYFVLLIILNFISITFLRLIFT